jgi:pilus assembly protein CpaC
MTKTTPTRTATLAALLVTAGLLSIVPATAETVIRARIPAPGAPGVSVIGDGVTQFVPLGVGKTVVVDLPRDAKDVLVADPKIANAVVRTSRRAYLIGVAVGQTNVFFFDAEGRQIMGFDIAVTRDLNGIRAAIKRMFPDSEIRVDGVSDGIVLSGIASSPAEAQQAYDLAARLAGDANKVVNSITVRGRDQVMLRVTVAEVQRDIIKQLGIDISGALSYGQTVLDFNNANPSRCWARRWSTPTPSRGRGAASARRCAPWSAPVSSGLSRSRT